MELPLIYGLISGIFILLFCAKYLHSLLQGETKPHIYTILLYVIITGIIFYSQVISGAGFGSMYVGITCIFWVLILILSFWYGIKDITVTDKISLVLALASIPVWYLTGDPFLAVILLIIVDVFSSYPSVRKTYVNPYSENLFAFVIEFIGISFSILALSTLSFLSAGYLIYIMLFDIFMFLIIYFRRRTVKNTETLTSI